jgi:hypothetical protein
MKKKKRKSNLKWFKKLPNKRSNFLETILMRRMTSPNPQNKHLLLSRRKSLLQLNNLKRALLLSFLKEMMRIPRRTPLSL